jgi:hypothetical protein
MKGVRARIIADIKTRFTGMKQSDHFLLLVGNIESNPGPESAYISSTPLSGVDILSDKSISICNIFSSSCFLQMPMSSFE